MSNNIELYNHLLGPFKAETEQQGDGSHRQVVSIGGGSVSISDSHADDIQMIDAADASTTYIGKAAPGTATSEALWQVKRIAVSGTVTSILWADSDSLYDNIWDNRAGLTYG